MITVIGIGMAAVIYYFRMPLFRIYTDDPLVMDYATIRMKVIITTYFLGGLMHLFCSQLRAMGVSVMPMVVASIGQCVLPIVWVYTAFAWTRSLEVLYASYPVAWILTGVVHVVCYFITKRKLLRSLQDPLENE